MKVAKLLAGAQLHSPSGQWYTLRFTRAAKILSSKYGIFRVLLNGKVYSVDYKSVEVVS